MQLRDVVESDLNIFFEHQRDPVANRMADFPARDAEAFFTHWKTKVLAEPTCEKKTIVVGGQVAGSIFSWQLEDKRLVGYWLGSEYWGMGIATKALAEFLPLVKTRPLYAYVAKHNIGSVRVLEKCGFEIFSQQLLFSKVQGREIEDLLMRLS